MALTDKLTAIAHAIRAKTGKSEMLTLAQMPNEIAGIATGGGSSADVRYVTFMNGDTVLYKKPVAVGDDCVDVLTKGLIETPTKESTAQYHYTYYGWGAADGGAADANILKNITQDKTVYAIFTATVRTYTITYLDADGSQLKSLKLAYGTTPAGYTPEKEGYKFMGWNPAVTTVTGDATYTAVWESKVYYTITFLDDDGVTVLATHEVEAGTMPVYTPTKDGSMFMGWTPALAVATGNASYVAKWSNLWVNVIADVNDGTYKEKHTIGETITLPVNGIKTLTMRLVAMDTDVDSSGKKIATTWISDNCITSMAFGSNVNDWANSTIRTYFSNTVLPALPQLLQDNVKAASKTSQRYASNAYSTSTTTDKLWIPSRFEVSGEGTRETKAPHYSEAFPDANSRIRDDRYWLRTIQSNAGSFYIINAAGSTGSGNTSTAPCGVIVGFCI